MKKVKKENVVYVNLSNPSYLMSWWINPSKSQPVQYIPIVKDKK